MTKSELMTLSELLDKASDIFMEIAVHECDEQEKRELYCNKALKCSEVRLSLKYIRAHE